jgi:hypothetical protein
MESREWNEGGTSVCQPVQASGDDGNRDGERDPNGGDGWRFFGGGFGVAERGRLRQASSKRNAEIVAIFDGASNQERKSRSRKASSADSLASENQES